MMVNKNQNEGIKLEAPEPSEEKPLHTVPLETKAEHRRRHFSLFVMHLTTLVQCIGASIVVTGMWPYLKQLDDTANKEWFGMVIAANPFGQLICAPLIGWWCNKIKGTRIPSIACVLVFIFSNVWYAILPIHTSGGKYFILISRFLSGASSASLTSSRTFVTQGTLVSERTAGISHQSLAQAVGYVLGPVGQLILAPLGREGWSITSGYSLNMYTGVGWLLALLGILNLSLLHPRIFKESDIAQREAKVEMDKNNADSKDKNFTLKDYKPDYPALTVILFTFLVVIFNFVILETLGSPVCIEQFGWSPEKAIKYLGLTMVISSAVTSTLFFIIPRLAQKIDERILLIGPGVALYTIGRMFFFPFGGPVAPMSTHACFSSETDHIIPDLEKDECIEGDNFWKIDQYGCPPSQEWCFRTSALSPIIVAAGYAVCTIATPFCMALCQTIFSKMLGPKPQGLWMGGLTAATSLSRVIGPIFVTMVYTKYGTIATNGIATALMATPLLFLGIFYKRLVVLKLPTAREP